MRFFLIPSTVAAGLLLCGPAQAALTYSSLSEAPYSENFDTLPNTGSGHTWTNNSSIPGWYVFHSTANSGAAGRVTDAVDNRPPADWAPNTLLNTTGVSSSRLFAYGPSGSTDRSLGAIAGSSSSANAGDFFYALVLQNTSGQAYESFTLSYSGEQWYDQTNTTTGSVGPHTLRFSHLVKTGFSGASDPAAADLDIATQSDFGAYTLNSALDFTTPTTSSTSTSAAPLDGNDAANRVLLSATIPVNWAPGDYLILRWWDDDNNGNDQPLSIDDVSFSAATAIPEPASLGLTLLTVATLLSRRRHS